MQNGWLLRVQDCDDIILLTAIVSTLFNAHTNIMFIVKYSSCDTSDLIGAYQNIGGEYRKCASFSRPKV